MELDETRARPRVRARWCTPFQASETITADYASSDEIVGKYFAALELPVCVKLVRAQYEPMHSMRG